MTEVNTGDFLAAIFYAKNRMDVVPLYKQAIQEGLDSISTKECRFPLSTVTWHDINEAIINRWSLAGLKWIKREAWKP